MRHIEHGTVHRWMSGSKWLRVRAPHHVASLRDTKGGAEKGACFARHARACVAGHRTMFDVLEAQSPRHRASACEEVGGVRCEDAAVATHAEHDGSVIGTITTSAS